ncbi:MAG: hypothetical protein M0036_24580 [Desulfobacteraceae bacterium]|nr:hypothetical protein [Desulfobacteraceae bacterium]
MALALESLSVPGSALVWEPGSALGSALGSVLELQWGSVSLLPVALELMVGHPNHRLRQNTRQKEESCNML